LAVTGKKQAQAFVVATLLVMLHAACVGNHVASQEPAAAASPPSAKTMNADAAHEAPHWSYEEPAGPASWSALDAEWKICGEGRNQSPIDIGKTATSNSPALKEEFKSVSLNIIHHEHAADVLNNGHTIQVNDVEGDTLRIGGRQFQLLQYHFHSPSEHTVGGRHYPMEMHLVHQSADGKLAVVAVFIEEGEPNAAFAPIWSNLPKTKDLEHHLRNVKGDIGSLLPGNKTAYRYDGSLTTPPCSEGVQWIVMTTPIQLSTQQLGAFRAIIKDNNRPTQPLNGRAVVTNRITKTDTN
jgi:carbonic anhydrase